ALPGAPREPDGTEAVRRRFSSCPETLRASGAPGCRTHRLHDQRLLIVGGARLARKGAANRPPPFRSLRRRERVRSPGAPRHRELETSPRDLALSNDKPRLRIRPARRRCAAALARQRQAGAQAGAAARARGERDRPAERAYTLADTDEPDTARTARPVVRGQPDAVVAHLEPELVSPPGETHPHAFRVRVSGDVGERLLDDAVDRCLDLLRQALREPLGGERGGDLVPPAEDFEVRLERPREPVEVEPGRAQQLRQLAHLAEGHGDQASRLARPRAELSQLGREL